MTPRNDRPEYSDKAAETLQRDWNCFSRAFTAAKAKEFESQGYTVIDGLFGDSWVRMLPKQTSASSFPFCVVAIPIPPFSKHTKLYTRTTFTRTNSLPNLVFTTVGANACRNDVITLPSKASAFRSEIQWLAKHQVLRPNETQFTDTKATTTGGSSSSSAASTPAARQLRHTKPHIHELDLHHAVARKLVPEFNALFERFREDAADLPRAIEYVRVSVYVRERERGNVRVCVRACMRA